MEEIKSVLITGVAGFIGASLSKKFLINGINVIGIDNINSYYDQKLKKSRLKTIQEVSEKYKSNFVFYKSDIESEDQLENIFKNNNFSVVIHLAAQAGVRYSIKNPNAYFHSNLLGFGNILEVIRKKEISNFIFASSSSVYGANKKLPFEEKDNVDHPVSLYAATKKSNELMAFSYSHLYKIPTTGLRFFTVYGPWGRPDMAPMIFTKSIIEKNKIQIFNNGKMRRDFTFIDDITEGIFRCCFKTPSEKNLEMELSKSAPYKIFNIGNNKPVELMYFIQLIEDYLGIKAEKEFTFMQKGDVVETWADTSALTKWINYNPSTSIEDGMKRFIDWYKIYY